MFTTSITFANNEYMEVFWLRTILPSLTDIYSHKIYKLNKGFKVSISPAAITAQMDELYEIYFKHIDFDASDTIYNYLHAGEHILQFDSYKIEVWDGETLIAVGFFDKGNKAVTGILNFYHPEYKKYSLGKYLMLLKMQFAISCQMDYYYTGYLSPDYPKFDYKVFPDPDLIEVFIPELNVWVPYRDWKDNLNSTQL